MLAVLGLGLQAGAAVRFARPSLWISTDPRCCPWFARSKVPKRASAVALTQDGAYVLAADKFGDVHVAPTRPGECGHQIDGTPPGAALPRGCLALQLTPGVPAWLLYIVWHSLLYRLTNKRACPRLPLPAAGGKAPAAPELLLGHFCSILTSLTPSPDGRFVVSTDRDGKARVSVLPADALQGAHEIQSFCLGHTDAVTASTFVASGGKVGGRPWSWRCWGPASY